MEAVDLEIPALRSLGGAKAVAAIAAVSVAIVAFLIWLIYFNRGTAHGSEVIGALPAVNAGLNALSTAFLVTGYIAIRQRRFALHIKMMLAAVASSALFFICYVIYHMFHGDTKFVGTGVVRPVYYFILITHIVLSAIAVPMILTSLYLSLSGRLATHRRVSRWTLPVWLYVSVTGVLIFVFLKLFNSGSAT